MEGRTGVHADKSDTLPLVAIPLLSLAAFSVSISARIIDPLLPHLASKFDISLGVASGAVTLFAIAYGVAQVIFGPLGGLVREVSGYCIGKRPDSSVSCRFN
jgi:predicted MFS family arabinose efflux permease